MHLAMHVMQVNQRFISFTENVRHILADGSATTASYNPFELHPIVADFPTLLCRLPPLQSDSVQSAPSLQPSACPWAQHPLRRSV